MTTPKKFFIVIIIIISSCTVIEIKKPQKEINNTPTPTHSVVNNNYIHNIIETYTLTPSKTLTYTIAVPTIKPTLYNTHTKTEIWDPRIDYKTINIGILNNNTDSYFGEKVQIRGIMYIFSYPYFHLRAIDPGLSEEQHILVMVLYAPVAQPPDVYCGDDIIIYGVVKGRQDGPDENYQIVSQILIDLDFVELFTDSL